MAGRRAQRAGDRLPIRVRGWGRRESRGKEGLATLVSDLLTEGAADLSASDYKHRLSGLGARISLTVGRDAIYGGLETLSRRLSPSADLLRLALTAPRFDPEAIERVKSTEPDQPGFVGQRPENDGAQPMVCPGLRRQ